MIELKGVSYRYRLAESRTEGGDENPSILALDHVSLQLREGESVSIIGSNGSGKTTLVKLFNALMVPDEGEVWVDGVDARDKESQKLIRQKVGMVFQNPDNQIISTSVEREIAFGLENLALPYDEMKQKVEWALERFHLEEYRSHSPHRLSGGEKQRVALAAVLSMQPKYLILDEPTSLLDSQGKKEVLSLIQELAEQRKVTVIHITQFAEEAVSADRVLVMHQGKILRDGTPMEVLKQKEELENVGLEAPFPLRMASALRQRGWSISDECLTIDGLANEIRRVFQQGRIRARKVAANSRLVPSEVEGQPTADSQAPQISMMSVDHLYDQGLPTERKALDVINLKINKGDFVGLIGPTGSGKSTLVQHLNGLLLPTSGEVIVEGQNLKDRNADLKRIRQKVGLVFQFPERQLFEDTVYEDVAFGPKNLGLSEKDIDARVKESMRDVGLDFELFAHRSPFFLSGGEQRKVAIAGILALKPDILALDEPTCGLDAKSTREIKRLLKELNSAGATIILISHNMDLMAELAGKVALLDQGKLLALVGKEELFRETDRMRALGLDPAQVVELAFKLREKGVEIERRTFTEDELLAFFENRP
jgi:energy-coupling factor transport system ATP-binding protein